MPLAYGANYVRFLWGYTRLSAAIAIEAQRLCLCTPQGSISLDLGWNAPPSIQKRKKQRSCEQFKTRQGSIPRVCDQAATMKCDGFPAPIKGWEKRRSCEQFKARQGSIPRVCDRAATMKYDGFPAPSRDGKNGAVASSSRFGTEAYREYVTEPQR